MGNHVVLKQALQRLCAPKGYKLKAIRDGKQNQKDIWVFRYEKSRRQK
ncbi:hypothetical protein [Melghirimyces algeriensis]|nr:hypothetical protein [Melghirimyces algeriensis]